VNFHLWLAFVAASAVMGLAPGPAVTSIVGYALSSGRATALDEARRRRRADRGRRRNGRVADLRLR